MVDIGVGIWNLFGFLQHYTLLYKHFGVSALAGAGMFEYAPSCSIPNLLGYGLTATAIPTPTFPSRGRTRAAYFAALPYVKPEFSVKKEGKSYCGESLGIINMLKYI